MRRSSSHGFRQLRSQISGSFSSSDLQGDERDYGAAAEAIRENLAFYARLSLLGVGPIKAKMAALLYTVTTIIYWRGYGLSWEVTAAASLVVLVVAISQLYLAVVGYFGGTKLLQMLFRSIIEREQVRKTYVAPAEEAYAEQVERFHSVQKRRESSKVLALPADELRASNASWGEMGFEGKAEAVPTLGGVQRTADKADEETPRSLFKDSATEGEHELTRDLSDTFFSRNPHFLSNSVDVDKAIRRVILGRKMEFYVAIALQIALISFWHVRASQLAWREKGRDSWEAMAALPSLLVGCVVSIPFTAQAVLGNSILDMCGVLTVADIEGFRDVIVGVLSESSRSKDETIAELDVSRLRLLRHIKSHNKVFRKAITSFLAMQFVLIFLYIFLAFQVSGGEAIEIVAQVTLIVIATFTASNALATLRLIARPADRWQKILVQEIAHFRIMGEANRVFGDYAAFKLVLSEMRIGFLFAGFVVTTTDVFRAAATLVIAMGIAIFEKFA